jgi:hypothetical protein
MKGDILPLCYTFEITRRRPLTSLHAYPAKPDRSPCPVLRRPRLGDTSQEFRDGDWPVLSRGSGFHPQRGKTSMAAPSVLGREGDVSRPSLQDGFICVPSSDIRTPISLPGHLPRKPWRRKPPATSSLSITSRPTQTIETVVDYDIDAGSRKERSSGTEPRLACLCRFCVWIL